MSTLRHCLAVAVLMLGACVTFVVQAAESAAPAAAAAAATDAPPANNDTYIIGPGDQLQLFVWRNPELSANIPVRPDGKISTPLVPDMVAVGKTPTELAKDLEKVLAEYIRSPQVNVIVAQPASVFSQVRVIGQVAKPQAVAFRQGMSVLDVVLAVGGLAPFAAGNRSKIIRKVDGKEREIKVKLADLVNKGDMKQNVPMIPGDVLVVPESRF
jgi:polysaccharide export outer membrane protein